MRGHGGSNAVAGDTHDGGNKAMRVKEGRVEKKIKWKSYKGGQTHKNKNAAGPF